MSQYSIQPTFTRGELSPRLRSRVDTAHWRSGLAQCQNFQVMPQGGLRRREGTKFIAAAKYSDRASRLIPFEYSDEQAYVLEFGDGYIRFFAEGGQVKSGLAPFEIASPYASTDVFNIQYAQSFDVVYLGCKGKRPKKLARVSETSWLLSDVEFTDGPYLSLNVSTTTLALSSTTGTATVTASSVAGINDGNGFVASDVGRWFRFVDTSAQISCWQITAVGSPTSVTATLKLGLCAAGTATTQWRLGAWCDYLGWPYRVCFYQERLCWGRTTAQPQTIWLSKQGGLEHHGTSDVGKETAIKDTDPLNLTIRSNEGNAVQWMLEDDGILLGTQTALRLLGSSSGALTPTTPGQRRISRVGSRPLQPLQIGQTILYLGRYSNQIRECTYSINQSGYVTPELSILSEHLLRSGITSWCYAENPDGVAYVSVANGDLIALTYDRDQQLGAMAPQRIAGAFGTRKWGVVESAVAIPGDTRTETWLLVKRTINGATARYVERIEAALEDGVADIVGRWYLDSALSYSGTPISQVFGLDHLEGQTVGVLADGAVLPDQVVVNGSITLPNGRTAADILVGLRYTSKIETLPLAQTAMDGLTFGRKNRVNRVIIDFMETGLCRVGNARGKEQIARRSTATKYDTPEPLFTGFKDIKTDSSWEDYGVLEIETDAPLPVVIRSLTAASDLEG